MLTPDLPGKDMGSFSSPKLKCRKNAWGVLLIFATVVLSLSGVALAQAPVMDVSSGPAFVIASGGSEVLGTILLTASTGCGGNADGRCVSTGGAINFLYLGTPIENSVATGITIRETIGGVTKVAPTAGTLITGSVTVFNSSAGGQVSIAIKGGVDLASGDMLTINGVRGRIVSSPAVIPGTPIDAQLSVSGTLMSFTYSRVRVALSATGLEFVNIVPGAVGNFTVTYREGFNSAFVQYLPTKTTGTPSHALPAFGATNNTQLHLDVTGLNGRITWPQTVPSQLAGSGGVGIGGSELQLISQNFDGSQATYEFATADQDSSNGTLESFAITSPVCGGGALLIQAQLYPTLGKGRPSFKDTPVPSSDADPILIAPRCVPSPLVKVSGDNQIGVVGMTLPEPLAVMVQDANGNPVPGVIVNFSAATNGATVSPASTTTDAAGVAQTSATLSPEAGTYQFAVAVGSLSATFFATAVPGQVPPFPLTKAVPHFVVGEGFSTKIVITNLVGQVNPVQVNFLTQSGALIRNEIHTLPPNGRIDLTTGEGARFGELTTQWALVGSQWPAGVSSLFEQKVSASSLPLSAASFPAPDPVQKLTLPFALDTTSEANRLTSGLAFANVSSKSNNISLQLVDDLGVVLATDSFSLPPFGQTTFGLDQRPAFKAVLESRQPFFGSIIIAASNPVSVIDAGSVARQFFTIAGFKTGGCLLGPFSNLQTTIIPHIPVGGGWGAQVFLTNLCQVQSPLTIEAFDPAGILAKSFLASNTTMPPQGTAVFKSLDSERFGPLNIHSARITSQVGLGVQILLEFAPTSGESPTRVVGASWASSIVGQSRFVLPLDFATPSDPQASSLSVGLALANVSSSTNDVLLQLVDSQGLIVAKQTSINLPPAGQTAFAVGDLPAFRGLIKGQPTFNGSLQIICTQPAVALAVGFDFGPAFTLPLFIPPGPQSSVSLEFH